MRRPSSALLARVAAVLGLLVLAPFAARPVLAAEVTVPDVTGKTQAAATTLLQASGLAAHAVDVAEGEVGRVHSQAPTAGAVVETGQSVEIRIGFPLRVQTTAPDVVGRPVDQAVADLASAYVVEVETVAGPPEQAGLVLEQAPAAGEPLLFRGILRLRAVAGSTAEGSAIVPPLLGRTAADAKKAADLAGLVLVVKEVEDAVAAPGQIVSQDPPSGAEILVGGTITVRVSKAPAAGSEGAPVPDVVGLAVGDAEKALLLGGFAVQADFSQSQGQSPWAVFDQFPKGGEVAPLGSKVKIAVALPSGSPSQVPAPSVIGLPEADAQAVLTAAGLQAQVVVQPSNLQQGIAFLQSPSPGTMLAPGGVVKVTIAGPPPGGWTPPVVKVPAVVGLTPDGAYAALVFAGLWPKSKKVVAPNAPLGLVHSQSPHAGATVSPGSQVSFYVPEATLVPHLVAKSRNQAISLLQQAGLNAAPQGPPFGIGSTKVVSQSHPPGTKVAKGTTIAFAYQWTGGIPVPKVAVPSVVGLTKALAQQVLSAKNLGVQFQGPNFGFGSTQVTAQNPGPGALVPVGSTVLVVYKYAGGFPMKVQVPNVLGKTKAQASQAIAAKNLVPQLQGPNFGIGSTKVTSQNPPPGTLVNPGSPVTAVYVYTGGIQPFKVTVPNVKGMKPADAKAVLQSKGLHGVTVGPLWGIGKPFVFSQNPSAGAHVNFGSTVTLVVKWKP